MAEVLQQLTQDFNRTKAVGKERAAFAREYNKKRGNWNAYSQRTLDQLRARAKALKAKGTTNNIRQDSEIRKLETALHAMDKDVEYSADFVKAFGAPMRLHTQTLETRLTAEIATRSKALTTKVGLGNKSLPGLRALLVEVQQFKRTEPYRAITSVQAEDYNMWGARIDISVRREIDAALAGK